MLFLVEASADIAAPNRRSDRPVDRTSQHHADSDHQQLVLLGVFEVHQATLQHYEKTTIIFYYATYHM